MSSDDYTMVSSLYDMLPQGIMVFVFIKLNWLLLKLESFFRKKIALALCYHFNKQMIFIETVYIGYKGIYN